VLGSLILHFIYWWKSADWTSSPILIIVTTRWTKHEMCNKTIFFVFGLIPYESLLPYQKQKSNQFCYSSGTDDPSNKWKLKMHSLIWQGVTCLHRKNHRCTLAELRRRWNSVRKIPSTDLCTLTASLIMKLERKSRLECSADQRLLGVLRIRFTPPPPPPPPLPLLPHSPPLRQVPLHHPLPRLQEYRVLRLSCLVSLQTTWAVSLKVS